jgi:Core binding factor beta subunit
MVTFLKRQHKPLATIRAHDFGSFFMNDLTQRLTSSQPVIMGGSQPSVEELRKRIEELRYVLVKFTETRGGTELGFELDDEATDASRADFEQASGTVHVEGTLILNDDPVRCVADLDLATLKGTGHLVPVEESAVTAG